MKYNYLHLTKKHIVLIAILVCALELPLSLWERRKESTSDSSVIVTYTGLPFEATKITDNVTWEPGLESKGAHERSRYRTLDPNKQPPFQYRDPHPYRQPFTVTRTAEYLWNGIILNTMLLTVFSIIIVKLSTRIHDEIEYRRRGRH